MAARRHAARPSSAGKRLANNVSAKPRRPRTESSSETLLLLQSSVGNRATAGLLREVSGARADHDLEAAARTLARLDGSDATRKLSDLEFYAGPLGITGAVYKRVATNIAALSKLSGAQLYGRALRIEAGELEAYWVVVADWGGTPLDALVQAVRAVRAYRLGLTNDLTETLRALGIGAGAFIGSLDAGEFSGLFDLLTPEELARLYGPVLGGGDSKLVQRFGEALIRRLLREPEDKARELVQRLAEPEFDALSDAKYGLSQSEYRRSLPMFHGLRLQVGGHATTGP